MAEPNRQNENTLILQVLAKLQKFTDDHQRLVNEHQKVLTEIETYKRVLLNLATVNIPLINHSLEKASISSRDGQDSTRTNAQIQAAADDSHEQSAIMQNANRDRQDFKRALLRDTRFPSHQPSDLRRQNQARGPSDRDRFQRGSDFENRGRPPFHSTFKRP